MLKNVLVSTSILTLALAQAAIANDTHKLPIADVHVHYSHDSVDMTPPERVIELMRSAQLKFALVSSSDDHGTQLLSELAPDLIVPGLRPYRQRGEIGTWFTDPKALEYVEQLLAKNQYATIGEFHLNGASADLNIPKKIVELAVEHNLILHAHSDADAVQRLLAHHPNIKVIWAHSGFEDPKTIANMLAQHERLWADLAFRSDVGSGGSLSTDWLSLFETHPDRMMLGTDTYTPERMYFLPEHAETSRTWLAGLPDALAEKIAWKNAYDLIMPVWNTNRANPKPENTAMNENHLKLCEHSQQSGGIIINNGPTIVVEPMQTISVSKPFSAKVSVCGNSLSNASVELNATMPAHGHGMNYKPEHTVVQQTDSTIQINVDGLILHMPGQWQWSVEISNSGERIIGEQAFQVR